MASQKVQSQLSKQLTVDAAGISSFQPRPIPNPLSNHPPQQPFPAYDVGYDVTADVDYVWQRIPAPPPNGQSSSHPFWMLSEDNLHPILFQLEPFPDSLAGVPVPVLVNEVTNAIEKTSDGRTLRYFSHLPRWVGVDVPGMTMELWTRLDPRVEMSDILDRLNLGGQKKPKPNAFNMRRLRFRTAIDSPPFSSGRQHGTASEIDLLSVLSREQLLLNTNMVVDLANGRLLKPVLSGERRIQGYVNSGLPLDHFLVGFPVPIAIPSDRQMVWIELRKRMQTLAMRRGQGIGAQAFHQLPKSLHPAWWHKEGRKDAATKITDIDGKTHEEWIAEVIVRYPGSSRAGLQRPRLQSRGAQGGGGVLPSPLVRPSSLPSPSPAPAPAGPRAALFPRPGQVDAGVRAATVVSTTGASIGGVASASAQQQGHDVGLDVGSSGYMYRTDVVADAQSRRQAGTGADNDGRLGSGSGVDEEDDDERLVRLLTGYLEDGE